MQLGTLLLPWRVTCVSARSFLRFFYSIIILNLDLCFTVMIKKTRLTLVDFLAGYFATIYLVEKLGRRWIQIQGFLITALMFAIIAGGYDHIGTAGKFVCLALLQVSQPVPYNTSRKQTDAPLLQFFFNFGANATTFIIPAELFPTRVRGFAHGFSAATGKIGAILSALLFNYLSGADVMGLANVLWIFFACCLLGAVSTYFLIPETKGRDADVTDYEEWMEMNIRER